MLSGALSLKWGRVHSIGRRDMKKLSWITSILVCAAVLLAAIGSVCGAIGQIAGDAQFYSGMSRAAVTKYLGAENDPQADAKVTEYIGLTDAEQTAFAAETSAFMRGETDVQPDILSEKEQQHMLDVRALVTAAADMSRTYMAIAAVLAVAAAWTAARLEKRFMPKAIGALVAVSIVMMLVSSVMDDIESLGFAQVFVQMHEALFQNDLWLMNPETDILIRMMPQPLFEQALLNAAGTALRLMTVSVLMLAAVHFIVERMLRRHVIKS